MPLLVVNVLITSPLNILLWVIRDGHESSWHRHFTTHQPHAPFLAHTRSHCFAVLHYSITGRQPGSPCIIFFSRRRTYWNNHHWCSVFNFECYWYWNASNFLQLRFRVLFMSKRTLKWYYQTHHLWSVLLSAACWPNAWVRFKDYLAWAGPARIAHETEYIVHREQIWEMLPAKDLIRSSGESALYSPLLFDDSLSR